MSDTRRTKMTIYSEPVAEIDLKRMQLDHLLIAVWHSAKHHRRPLHASGSWCRSPGSCEAVVRCDLRSSKPIKRWPTEMLKDDAGLRQYRVPKSPNLCLANYPAIGNLGEPLDRLVHSWADLMWLESTVMFSTMLNLMHDHQTPSLVVHDSLIVPVSKAEAASEALKGKFQSQRKVLPKLKINWPSRTEQ